MVRTTTVAEPTLKDVEVLEIRLAGLELDADRLQEREQELSGEIAEIHTSGSGNKKDLPGLSQQRREVREQRADMIEAAATVRTQVAQDLEVASLVAATQRVKDVRKAYGSLRKVLEADERAVEVAAIEFKAKAERVNERFTTLAQLRAEAEALYHRFPAVPAGPRFPAITVPARREVCIQASLVVDSVMFPDHGHIAKAMEKCEYKIRTRRSYRELGAGTPGAAIIEAAGPRPWPAFTEAQEAILAGRKRDAAQEAVESRRFAVEGDRATERSGLLGAAG